MADPQGFIKITTRQEHPKRPIPLRLKDWREVYENIVADNDPATMNTVQAQASRCMDCGIPFCHQGCPLGNIIPEWNTYAYKGLWQEGAERLDQTNNFPEITGRICPAPCEDSCVLGINQPPVTIKQIEYALGEKAFADGLIKPQPPMRLTGKTVAVVGSGPAGLAAAQQLTRVGHTVAVYERDARAGGLLRYGIPDFKLEKHVIDRRLAQMEKEGTRFRLGVKVGDDISWDELCRRYDAVIMAHGAGVARDLPIPGRDLSGIYPAMEYLTAANKIVSGESKGLPEALNARNKHVVIIGGGDTGADCVGTAHRQKAKSVTSLAIGRMPPFERDGNQPWPTIPTLFEMSTSHEEGGKRHFLASTVEFLGAKGHVENLKVAQTQYHSDGSRTPESGSEYTIPADLVLLALGFTGPESSGIEEQLYVKTDSFGRCERSENYMTASEGVFVAGDAGRGQSLVVWAIAEGRAVAAAVDAYLTGSTVLPSPVRPTDATLRLPR